MDNMPDDPDFKKFFEESKPTWQNDNYGIRGNNAQTNREQAPVVWPRATVDPLESLAAPTDIEPPAAPTPSQGTTDTTAFPFQVTTGTNDAGDATWSVNAGYISTIYTDGTDTDRDSDVGEYSIYVKVHVDLDPDNNYRLVTESCIIKTDNEEVAEPALVVTWVDPDTKDDGTWFVKVADITAEYNDAGNVVITEVIQVLRANLINYVVAADEVIILTAI